MYRDIFLKNRKIITVQNPTDGVETDCFQMREEFHRMTDVIRGLADDIGWSDMVFVFVDNDTNFERAKYLLGETDIKWKVQED